MEFNSLDAQRESCEAYIASQRAEGWSLVSDRYDDGGFSGGTLVRSTVAALSLEVFFGGVTVTGSLMAFGKLQGILPGGPLTFRGQNAINALLFAACCGCGVSGRDSPR